MKGLISCSVACRFYDIPTGKCRLKCEKKSNPDAEFYDDCPLPDAVEVKHGEWVYSENAHDWNLGGYICGVCHTVNNNLPGSAKLNPLNFRGSAYCPNCGAKMDGGDNDGK